MLRVPVKLGIVTPVLTRLPGAHGRWEEAAGLDEVERIAVEADRLGYHHLTCSEHVAVPCDAAATRGATYWDPLAVFGYLAGRTERIRLATHVLVLGYHHPLEIAKRYGTLDRVCSGRLVLGVGVGSLQEEFALLGASFADRGRRADDALGALRAALSQSQPAYHGEFFDFGGFIVDPPALQPRVPIWIGGRTRRSLRRALEHGDGWAPFGLATNELAAMLSTVGDARLEVVVQTGQPLDPSQESDAVRARVQRLTDIGATALNLRFVHHSLEHYLEQLAAMRELVPDSDVSP